MNISRTLSSIFDLLCIFLLTFGQHALAQAIAGTIQLQGKVVVAQGGTLAVMTDAGSRNFPNKLYKVVVDANTKVLESIVRNSPFGGAAKPISISDIKEGDRVMMLGRLASITATDYVATSITRQVNAGEAASTPTSQRVTPGQPSATQTQSTAASQTSDGRATELHGTVVWSRGNLIDIITDQSGRNAGNLIRLVVSPTTQIMLAGSGNSFLPTSISNIKVDDRLDANGQFDGKFDNKIATFSVSKISQHPQLETTARQVSPTPAAVSAQLPNAVPTISTTDVRPPSCINPGIVGDIEEEAKAVTGCLVSQVFFKCDADYYSAELQPHRLSDLLEPYPYVEYYEYKGFRQLPLKRSDLSPADRLNKIEWRGSIYVTVTAFKVLKYSNGKWGTWGEWQDNGVSQHLAEVEKKNGQWSINDPYNFANSTDWKLHAQIYGPVVQGAFPCQEIMNQAGHK